MNESLLRKVLEFVGSLTDEELDDLLTHLDSGPETYVTLAEWVTQNRPELARRLFGLLE